MIRFRNRYRILVTPEPEASQLMVMILARRVISRLTHAPVLQQHLSTTSRPYWEPKLQSEKKTEKKRKKKKSSKFGKKKIEFPRNITQSGMMVLGFPIFYLVRSTMHTATAIGGIRMDISIDLVASAVVVSAAFFMTTDKSFNFNIAIFFVFVFVFVVGFVGAGRGGGAIGIPVAAAEVGTLVRRKEKLVVDEAGEVLCLEVRVIGEAALGGGAIEAQGQSFVLEDHVVRVGGPHPYIFRGHSR